MKIQEFIGYVWVSSDYKMFSEYSQARYHEIVLKLRRFIKNQAIVINRGN